MRVHHLNCSTLCPAGGRLLGGEGRLVCHCLLIEGARGLILVDTGFGLEDLRDLPRRIGLQARLIRPLGDEAETAVRQVERLGFAAADVRDIVLTHLDPDHAGGIADFPAARVHVRGDELEAALDPRSLAERLRYKRALWEYGPAWVRVPATGDRWLGFDAVRALEGDELLMIPLPGHTRGHAGVAVRADAGWLLHCGDAYFFHGEMAEPPHCPLPLSLMQRIDDDDHALRVANQQRLRTLARERASEVTLFCSHDPVELARFETAAASRRR